MTASLVIGPLTHVSGCWCMHADKASNKVWIKIYVYLLGPLCGVFNFILAIFFLYMTADICVHSEAAHDAENFPSRPCEHFFQNIFLFQYPMLHSYTVYLEILAGTKFQFHIKNFLAGCNFVTCHFNWNRVVSFIGSPCPCLAFHLSAMQNTD